MITLYSITATVERGDSLASSVFICFYCLSYLFLRPTVCVFSFTFIVMLLHNLLQMTPICSQGFDQINPVVLFYADDTSVLSSCLLVASPQRHLCKHPRRFINLRNDFWIGDERTRLHRMTCCLFATSPQPILFQV